MSRPESKTPIGEAPCADATDAEVPRTDVVASSDGAPDDASNGAQIQPEDERANDPPSAEATETSAAASPDDQPSSQVEDKGPSKPGEQTFISQAPPFPSPSSVDAPALGGGLVGKQLDHFELLEVVGGGGMGLVFRAMDTALNRTVALKILSLDRTADEETVQRFRNEAQSAARLDHENIARVYYVGEDQGLNYIAFEFIEGVNLRDLVAEQGPLPLDQVLSIALQLTHALAHASSRGVVHRDIKPSNVLMAEDGRAKLVDMGLSRLAEPEVDHDLTSSGVTLGTFDYISPEQARDPRNADVRSDIYSLGCTLFYMLTGQPPFPEGNAMQKLLQHQGDAPPDPRALNPAVPEGLSRVVRKMLAKDPRRRYQAPRSLMADLSLLTTQLGIELPGVGVALLLPQQTLAGRLARRHLPWLVPLAAMLIGVAVVDWMWGGRQADAGIPPLLGLSPQEPPSEITPADGKKKPGPAEKVQPRPEAKGKKPLPAPPVPIVLPKEDAVPPVRASGENPKERLINRLAATPGEAPDGSAGEIEPKGSAGGLSVSGTAGSAAAEDTTVASRLDPGTVEEPAPKVTPITPIAPNTFVVTPAADGSKPGVFPTIKDALAKAKSGATIELHYTGPSTEPPFRLSLDNVTLRAGKDDEGNEYRPIVVFRPDSEDSTVYPRSMIALHNARLNLVNVALELRSPLPAAGGWTLFSLYRSNVGLRDCTMTIVNVDEQGRKLDDQVSFFQVRGDGPGAAMMMKTGMQPMPPQPINVNLDNCVARGEAVFLDAGHSLHPVELTWNNGLLATTEPLFQSHGGRSPGKGEEFRIRLDHLTANVRGGLALLESEPGYPHQLKTNLECRNSILLGTPDTPLVTQQGADMVMDLRAKFSWQGDKNLYEGIAMFWRVMDIEFRDPPTEMMYTAWKKHWDAKETPVPRDPDKPFGWDGLPDADRPVHEHVPGDYALKPDSQATGEATDNEDVGALLDLLPAPPTSRLRTMRKPVPE